MHRKITLFALTIQFIVFFCSAQILPKEGGVLNYRIIGFAQPQSADRGNYVLEIASGKYFSIDSFKKNVVVHTRFDSGKTIAEVPAFGCQYTWRVAVEGDKNVSNKLYHFSTGSIIGADTSACRLQILKQAEKYTDGYVFLDGHRALYDMQGRPVWYLPNVVPSMSENTQVRDLKITPQGTITFILSDALMPQVYEINYNAYVLWKGPNSGLVSGDSFEHYHHEFTRLQNGHYMAMGTENVVAKLPVMKDNRSAGDINYKAKKDSAFFPVRPFGTLIEYDHIGRIIWSWKASVYFPGSDVDNYIDPFLNRPEPDIHDNAFFFDEKNSCLYVCYRSISRVI